ncbi:MAG: tRNA lysidine(34) synthetase TilS [Phycisphaerae bacterium]|nr:tRNA lysidine(34) synthetase TilS [Phycisphaerae bacterium]MDD5380628.1 tRNA lysidine(34) synthetase TilS [Phycisphaerae bacterium]
MLLEFEKKVAGFIEANGLFDPADKILLAVSGGADSTALLYAMCATKAEKILRGDILCAHINHQLRGSESDGDEAFVIAQADKLNLAVITKRLDVRGFAHKNKLSIETAARRLRIERLLDIAKTNNCRWVATAHQKDDNAETIIQRLVRGTGFRGLGGIWPVRTFAEAIGFVRPLLCVRRDEIVEYLSKRSLKWREDRTNDDCKYRRNFIRHRLLPVLQQQCKGSIVEQLTELSQSAQRFYSLVCSSAEKIWPQSADCAADKVTLDLKSFLAQHPAVRVEMARRSLVYLGSGEGDLTQQHYERVLQLSQQKTSGKQVELPDGFLVWREYGKLIFARRQENDSAEKRIDKAVELQIPGLTQFDSFSVEVTVLETDKKRFEKFKREKSNLIEWFDLDNVKLPLVVRCREQGDRFVPLGLREEKKVGKFLTAAKTPQEIREKAIIIADAERIIWVWPVRICEQAKVTSGTRKILQLQVADAKIAD